MSKPDEGIPPSTYYVIDPEQVAELAHLMQQERVVTEGMGGLLPEGQELPEDGRVLDLACGPGGWAMEVAFTYPQMSVYGVDISPSLIEYARGQAQARHLENVHFRVMNIMQPLAFPVSFFDLINARFIAWFMVPAA
ncbi:MAG: class I SAM-dependent methyltransferase [Thermogemmatispora sp.]|uniref:class I SAM-dependent methyltransferase n=1 Tax=Thermogemmatispora sp. TaxID=1968838 RepID=UPI00260BED32|nr:class I SAM-dependent methyltransferase [Thermogemmatispora sp.]MBX5458101.1 class I SAM-dependent methyltransferase [Thermogemmatispora sp.]